MRGTEANTAHEAAGETVASYADVWRDSSTSVAAGGAAGADIVATSYSAVARAGGMPDTDAVAHEASLAAVLVAQRAARNRRRRLRRKGLSEWSVLSL